MTKWIAQIEVETGGDEGADPFNPVLSAKSGIELSIIRNESKDNQE